MSSGSGLPVYLHCKMGYWHYKLDIDITNVVNLSLLGWFNFQISYMNGTLLRPCLLPSFLAAKVGCTRLLGVSNDGAVFVFLLLV